MSSVAEICTQVASVVEGDYVIAETGRLAAIALRQAVATGGLATPIELDQLAHEVTRVLHRATGDLHLRLIHHPEGAPEVDDVDGYDAYWSAQATETAGGVRRTGRIADNVALVELGPVIGHPAHAGSWLSAAMTLCAGAQAVVLDLRDCLGGTPDGVALVCSYLVGRSLDT